MEFQFQVNERRIQLDFPRSTSVVDSVKCFSHDMYAKIKLSYPLVYLSEFKQVHVTEGPNEFPPVYI